LGTTAGELGIYAAKQALPFSFNNLLALNSQGVISPKDAALTVLGWKPAGREINDTPAEVAAHENSSPICRHLIPARSI